MQSESTAHLDGTRFATEELEDKDGTECEFEELSDDSDCSDNLMEGKLWVNGRI